MTKLTKSFGKIKTTIALLQNCQNKSELAKTSQVE